MGRTKFLSNKGGSKLKKAILTVLIVIASLVLIVFIGARVYFRLPVLAYYSISDKEFKIPGISHKLVPQGFDYQESNRTFYVGGYKSDGGTSAIYKVEQRTRSTTGFTYLADSEGNPLKVHVGGIAMYDRYMFVTGDDANILVFDALDFINAGEGNTAKLLGKISTKFGDDEIIPAWIHFTNDRMIVGEFYREPNYKTPDTHVFKGPSGEENHAIALCYKFTHDHEDNFGIESKPSEVYSLPGLVQGLAVNEDGKIWISQSWGTAKSTIACYDISKSGSSATMKTGDLELPVYFLDSSTLKTYIYAPPMSEEIVISNGRIYVINESASGKYFFGKLTGGRWCYSTNVNSL